MTAALQVNDLSWTIARRPILSNIEFELNRGQCLAIVGPNGAGKSSLLRLMAGLQPMQQGLIRVFGNNIVNMNLRQIGKQVAFLSQSQPVVAGVALFDVVRMGLTPHKLWYQKDTDQDRHQIDLALHEVGLSELANRDFASLSGGEQQRGLIARALVQQAKLILLDEPTNHLDIKYQHQILSLLKQLKLTQVMVLHDINLASEYSDQLLLLKNGQQQAFGATQNVINQSNLFDLFEVNNAIDQNPFSGKARATFSGVHNHD